jgi:hypothetical protein
MSNVLEAYESTKEGLEKAKASVTDAQAVFKEAENALEKHLEANLNNYILKDAKRVAPPKAVYALEKVETLKAFETVGTFSHKRESNIHMKNAISVYYNTNNNCTITITVPEKNNDRAPYYLNRFATKKQLKSRTKRTRELLEPIEDGIMWLYNSYKVDEKYVAAQKRIKTDPIGLFKELEK